MTVTSVRVAAVLATIAVATPALARAQFASPADRKCTSRR
jgi:hypothetical protein